MLAAIRVFLLRALVAVFIALLFVLVPLPMLGTPVLAMIKNGVVVGVLVCYLTKLLYDTFFYDRY